MQICLRIICKGPTNRLLRVLHDLRPISDVKAAISDSRLTEVVSCLERNANSATEVIGRSQQSFGYESANSLLVSTSTPCTRVTLGDLVLAARWGTSEKSSLSTRIPTSGGTALLRVTKEPTESAGRPGARPKTHVHPVVIRGLGDDNILQLCEDAENFRKRLLSWDMWAKALKPAAMRALPECLAARQFRAMGGGMGFNTDSGGKGMYVTGPEPWVIREPTATDAEEIDYYNACLQSMKADRNAWVLVNQRNFPTIQESLRERARSPPPEEGKQRAQTRPSDHVMEPHPGGVVSSRVREQFILHGTVFADAPPEWNGEMRSHPASTGMTGQVPTYAISGPGQTDPRRRTQTRPSDQLMEPLPVGVVPNRVGGPATVTAIMTDYGTTELGRRTPMGENRPTGTAIQTHTPAQPMRVQYDIASGHPFLTPIRGEDAPPVLHTDPVYHVLEPRRRGQHRDPYQRAVVTPVGVGSYTYLPAIPWTTRDYRVRTHQDDYRWGVRSTGANPFSF